MSGASKVRKVSEMSPSELSDFLDSFDNVLCDCDGVLYRGGSVLEGAPELLRHLSEERGKEIFYLSNNAIKDRAEHVEKMEEMGYPVQKDRMFHAGYAAANYLKSKGAKKAYVLGPKKVCSELEEVGIDFEYKEHDPLPDNWGDGAIEELLSGLDPAVDCVVVGFDVNLSYVKLIKAATYLKKEECLFVATDRDPSFPISRGRTLPGSGAPVSAVATVAAREPTVVGKPSVAAFEAVARQFPQVAPGRTVIFGDRVESDILLGRRCGLITLMVGTGVDTLEEAERIGVTPDVWAESLGQIWDRVVEDKGEEGQ